MKLDSLHSAQKLVWRLFVEDVVFEHFQAGTSSGVFLAGIESVSWLELLEVVLVQHSSCML